MPIKSKQQPPYYQQGTTIKQYQALLTQVNTDPPTAIIGTNTIGTITPAYISPGRYRLDSAGLFTLNKTGVKIGTLQDTVGSLVLAYPVDDTQINIDILESNSDGTYIAADNYLENVEITISVYQ